MKLVGAVRSGLGSLSYWMEKLEPYYTAKAGVRLYPGSLNVELERDYHLPANAIRLEKEEYGGTVSLSILPCGINGYPAFIIRTDKNAAGEGDHQPNVVEIAADVRLRDHFGLRDGDRVEITVESRGRPHG